MNFASSSRSIQKSPMRKASDMRESIFNLLDARRLPARLTPEQAAQLLGVSTQDIVVLVKARLLKHLGNPTQQACKYFASQEIEALAAKPDFLNRATRAIYNHWSSQNRSRTPSASTPSTFPSEGASRRGQRSNNQN